MNIDSISSLPVIGNIMQAAGITDPWIIVSVVFALLAIFFLAGWISAAKRARTSRKALTLAEEEIMGLQALTNLPPLQGNWEYAEGADPGSSLVFASAKELKRRQKGESPVAALSPERKAAPSPAADEPVDRERNVTAQVHDAIYASVANTHSKIAAKTQASEAPKAEKRKPKANGAAITSSDLPAINVGDAERQAAANAGKTGKFEMPEFDSDASLSSRIPRL